MDNLKAKAAWRYWPACAKMAALLFVLAALLTAQPARADIAPPEPPAGSNVAPGSETTQVQMVWEKVALKVITLQAANPALAGDVAAAKVTATFSMRNQGTAPEQLAVRFPLSKPDGTGDGTLNNFPEIQDFKAQVNQIGVEVKRVTTPNPFDKNYPPVAWGVFNVTFPPGKDVLIDVAYTTQPWGYLPLGTFNYILETGAGWKGPIGSVDLTVTLPYAADPENAILDDQSGYAVTPGVQLSGNDLHWHFDNLEPTPADNFTVTLILPGYWQEILTDRKAVVAAPQDGAAWGALARACKLAIQDKHGIRLDASSRKLYAEAVNAYEKAVALQPQVAKWHAGYAELLWWVSGFSGVPDPAIAERMALELKTALSLEPDNTQALGVLDEVSSAMPDVILKSSSGYTFLVLTASPTALPEMATASSMPTPLAVTPTALPATPPPSPATSPASPPSATAALLPATPPPLPAAPTQASPSTASSPPTTPPTSPTATPPRAGLCGAAGLAPMLAVGLRGMRRRRWS
jgi:hypothetical protein